MAIKKLFIFLFLFLVFGITSHLEASLTGKSVQQDTFKLIGVEAQSVYDDVAQSISMEVEKVAKSLSKYTVKLLGYLFGIWFMWQLSQLIMKRSSAGDFWNFILQKGGLLALIIFLIGNISYINRYIQIPLLETYKAFGGAVFGNGESNSVVLELSSNLSGVFNALNSQSGNFLTNAGAIVVSLIVMLLLLALFLQIFIILLKNYLRIMLPFAFSPILAMCYFFPSLRPIPIKAINICLDAIIKQGFIIVVVKIMSNVYYKALNIINEDLSLQGMILAVILTLVYKEFITVGESMSSELIGTQSMGSSYQSGFVGALTLAGGKLLAMTGVKAMGIGAGLGIKGGKAGWEATKDTSIGMANAYSNLTGDGAFGKMQNFGLAETQKLVGKDTFKLGGFGNHQPQQSNNENNTNDKTTVDKSNNGEKK